MVAEKEIKGKKVEKSQDLVSNLDVDNSNDDESDYDDDQQITITRGLKTKNNSNLRFLISSARKLC